MTIRLLLTLCCLWTAAASLDAQVEDTVLFPGLEGDALAAELKAGFYPNTVLSYGLARDIMYGDIYNVNDSVYCVYTGHRLYVDPGSDPSTFLYQNGSPDGINCEHTWPRSKGAAEGPAFSDMHHLFPTRAQVNEARSNFPYAEIDDEQTYYWYVNAERSGQKPTDNIEAYSEYRYGYFEPREAHKGNVARAMFYFYTLYKAQALVADPAFFEAQRETLCAWHELDPVDELEYSRTYQIAAFQDNKPNPFVLDCTLARRLYCPNAPVDCGALAVATGAESPPLDIGLELIKNGDRGAFTVQFNLDETSRVSISVTNMLGQSIEVGQDQQVLAGRHQWHFRMDQPGIYVASLRVVHPRGRYLYPVRFVVQ